MQSEIPSGGVDVGRPEGVRFGLAGIQTIFGIDLRTLALFRILLGLYLLADICLRLRDLTAHYSDAGIMPRMAQLNHLSAGAVSLHLANGSALFQAGLFAMAALAATCLIIGYRTRVATVASWILLLSVQNRNTFILSGEDNLAVLLTFWAMFLPLGARYSVDAVLDRNLDTTDNRYFSIATMALLVQGMSMYFFSALLKSDARWIPDGTAVYYALNLEYMATPFGLWFRQFEPLMQGLTYYVYFLELVGPFLIFSPIFHRTLRTALMVAFMTMHIGFWAYLEIGLFPVISIIMNLTFLPSWVWDRADGWLARRRVDGLAIWYDKDCSFCLKACRLLRMLLFLGDVPIRPAQQDAQIGPVLEQHNSWVVTRGDAVSLKWDAMHPLVQASPLFRPLALPMRLAWVGRLGDKAYDIVAANRQFLARMSESWFPWRPIPIRAGRFSNGLAGIFLVFVTIQNISTLPFANWQLPRQFILVRQALGLYQNWTMFAPHPELTSPWPVIEGRLLNGEPVDVYRGMDGRVDRTKPKFVSAAYANYRWRKFLSNLEDQSYLPVRPFLAAQYAHYLCRSWNADREGGERLFTLEIAFNVEFTPPSGAPRVASERIVSSYDCFLLAG
ncbi:HTTM domain-containing protein [Hoeflea sp. TYP-13]|uniref:HTTM domain-containing protein n=1 Tax=Hoeflea sp. TYP-13 TaxID=3230023 RepID=UPI0034C6B6C3